MILHIIHNRFTHVIDTYTTIDLDIVVSEYNKIVDHGFDIDVYNSRHFDFGYGNNCVTYIINIVNCDMNRLKMILPIDIYQIPLKYKRDHNIVGILS